MNMDIMTINNTIHPNAFGTCYPYQGSLKNVQVQFSDYFLTFSSYVYTIIGGFTGGTAVGTPCLISCCTPSLSVITPPNTDLFSLF